MRLPQRAAMGVAILLFCLPSQAKTPFVTEDLYQLADVSGPQFSADGQQVLYTLSTANRDTDSYQTDLMITDWQGNLTALTNTPKNSEWQPAFSPTGSKLAWLGDDTKDEGSQLFIGSREAKDARQLTHFKGSISDYVWTADGQAIVFVGEPAAPEFAGGHNPAPIEIDRFQFKDDYRGYLTAYQGLYKVALNSGEVSTLLSVPTDIYYPSVSPDGKWLAYVHKTGAEADRQLNYDLYILSLENGEKRQLSRFTGTDNDPYWDSRPAWSADSTKIVYLRSGEDKWMYYHPSQMVVVDIQRGQEWVPSQPDLSFYKPRFAADGSLYALMEGNKETHLVNLDVKTNSLRQLTQGPSLTMDYAIGPDNKLVVLQSNDLQPLSLFALETDEYTARLLVDHNSFLADKVLQRSEDFSFNAADGTRIDGLVVKPANYDPKQSYPLILRVHGGPVYQFSHEFMWDWQVYAAQGYVVAAINPRGSSGRGFDFAKAIYAAWGQTDTQDLLSGIDTLVTSKIADPARLAIGGWSYGGMLTNYVIASDTRFKAAISGAGTSNMLGNYGHDQYSREYELELGTPWDNKAAYETVSFPFLHANKITTPTLFQCGEVDFNVPCLGAEQMYQALKSLRIDTRLVIYPQQHHGLTVPSYLVHRLNQSVEWYNRYLK